MKNRIAPKPFLGSQYHFRQRATRSRNHFSSRRRLPFEGEIIKPYYQDLLSATRKLFPNLKINDLGGFSDLPRDFPTVGIMSSLETQKILMCSLAAKSFPNATFLIIPYHPGTVFMSAGRLYTTEGVLFSWNEVGNELSLGFASFADPLELNNYYTPYQGKCELPKICSSIGLPTVSPFIKKVVNNKSLLHRVLENQDIRQPLHMLVDPSDITVERVRAFFDRLSGGAIAAKPNNGSGGRGVRKFRGGEEAMVTDFLSQISKNYLLEEWIESHNGLVIDGKRMDWNIRVLVPPGDLSEWDIFDTTEIRYKEHENGSPAVNKKKGAKILTLREAIEILAISSSQKKKILRELETIARKVRSGLEEHLLNCDHQTDRRDVAGNSYFRDSSIGLDIIIDQDINGYLIEVNGANSGGVKSLADRRRGEDKFRAVSLLTKHLYQTARLAKDCSNLSRTPSVKKRRYFNLNANAYYNQGLAKSELGQYDDAILEYNKAIEIDPNCPRAYFNRGRSLFKLGRYEDAILDFTKAIEIDPDYSAAYNSLGLAKLKLGKLEVALKYYNEAIEKDSKLAQPYYNRGIVYFKLGHYNDARKDLTKAIEIDPNDSKAYNCRGVVMSKLGKFEDAYWDFNKALEIDPSFSAAHNNLEAALENIPDV